MNKIQKLLNDLGDPYKLKVFDLEEVIYRELNNHYEFEVSGIPSAFCTLYVWAPNHHEVVAIYDHIPTNSLKDLLGYYASLY